MAPPVLESTLQPTAADHPDGHERDLAVRTSDVLGRLWRFFISMRTGLALILLLAIMTLAGTLLAQVPAEFRGDPQAYADWLEAIRPKYGGWTGLLDALGLFHVFTSIWFRAVVAMLAVSLCACSVNRAPRLWKRAVHPRTRMTEAFYEHAPLHERIPADETPDAAVTAVRAAFRSRRYRTAVERDGDTVHVYGDRFRWAPFGTVVAHLSLVLVLFGAVAGVTWGFRDESFAVPVGSTEDVGFGTGLSAKAVAFHDSYYSNGAPSDYATELVLMKDGVPVRHQTVRVNEPLRYDGVAFYQSFFGAATELRVKGRDGATLFDRGVPLMYGSNDGHRRIGRFAMPEAGLTGLVVSPASGEVDPQIKAGQVQVEIYRDGAQAPIATKVVSQGRPATLAGLDVTFMRERQFTGLIVAHDPGAILIWIGVGLLVAGIVLVFFFQNRRVWVRVAPRGDGSDIRVGAAPRRDLAFGPDFRQLVDDMRLAVHQAREHDPKAGRKPC